MDLLFLFTGLGLGFVTGWLFFRQKGAAPVDTAELDRLKAQVIELDKQKSILANQIDIYSADKKKLIESYEAEKHKYETKITELTATIVSLTADNSEISTKFQGLEDRFNSQKEEIKDLQEKFTTQFKAIANDILKENSKEFTEQNKMNLDSILVPLRDKIKAFEEKVEKTYKVDSEERITLKTEIKSLMELNKQISEEANNLASALKGDNKKQGSWGEARLELILQKTGLTSGIHYRKQESLKDEEGKSKQPDFIINLPDNKNMVVDSKVSLIAYESFCNSENTDERSIYIKNHIDSIKNHVKDLSSKNYQNLYQINSPNFVLMYVPIESAFTVAVQHDPELITWALEEKNIVIVTTTTLLATLSTVSFIWKQDNQQRNVMEIARQSGALYDKFVGFLDDLIAAGKKMNEAKLSYDEAMKKLHTGNGNLIRRAEAIKDLGAKAQKSIPQTLVNRAEEPVIE